MHNVKPFKATRMRSGSIGVVFIKLTWFDRSIFDNKIGTNLILLENWPVRYWVYQDFSNVRMREIEISWDFKIWFLYISMIKTELIMTINFDYELWMTINLIQNSNQADKYFKSKISMRRTLNNKVNWLEFGNPEFWGTET